MKGNKEKKINRKGMKGNKNKKFLEPVLPHLPEEILFDIILRLPLSCRLKFRCVCKSWSIQFNNPKQLVLTGDNNVYTLDNDSLTSPLLDGIAVHCNKIEPSLASTALVNTRSSFVGTCNGLICVETPNNYFCLWNPFTNEYKLIPRPPPDIQSPPTHILIARIYGFGYDSKSDDYKLVRITNYSYCSNLEQSTGIVYSLRSNAWKQIQHITHLFSFRSQEYGVFCNGALHWCTESGLASKFLIALDMTDEIIREIPKPDDLIVQVYGNRRRIGIGVLDGCLCMLFSNISVGFEVWVMEDYGNRESWTKIYCIPKLKLRKKRPIQYLRRIECLKTGEVLLEVQLNPRDIWV